MGKVNIIPEAMQQRMKVQGIWSEAAPVALDRLRLVTISYYDHNGQERHDGQLVVLEAVAESVQAIFEELHQLKFPIHSILPIDHFEGDDNASMEANNSSAFNYREIEGSSGLISIHSYGLAIDVNPVQNPFIVFDETQDPVAMKLYPTKGWSYINRINQKPGMVEPIVALFKQHGFTVWGGNWTTPIDWHHFQTSRLVAELLAVMQPEHALDFFAMTKHYTDFFAASTDNATINQPLIATYKTKPDQFVALINQFLEQHRDVIIKENMLDYYQKMVVFLQAEIAS